MTNLARLGSALAVVLLAAVALPGAAAAGPPDLAYVRLAHLSPDTPDVDVWLASATEPDRAFTVRGVGYGDVSAYRALPADTYTVAMRRAGAPASSPPVIATTLTVSGGDARTVAATGLYQALGIQVLDDQLTMPPAGQARVRVVNAATTAPTVDLSLAGGPTIADGVGFARSTDYRNVPLGRWTVEAAVPGGAAPQRLPIDVAANAVYTVLLLDDGGRLGVSLHQDSAGTSTVPVGGVETGMGGTAPAGGPDASAIAALALVLAMAGLLVAAGTRRRALRS